VICESTLLENLVQNENVQFFDHLGV